MNQTTKALVAGSVITALGLVAATLMVPKAPAVKLATVVVTAQRLPSPQVVKLATVEVHASRADMLAAQVQESSKQAAIVLPSRFN
jgi:outer membrane cobalamin receptor